MKRTKSSKIGRYISIFKRVGVRNWYYSYRKDGIQVSKSLGTTQLGVATKLAIEIDKNLQEDFTPLVNIPGTIKDAIDQYFEYLESEGRRAGTLIRYRPVFHRFNLFCFRKKIIKLSQFNQRLFEQYRIERRKTASDGTRYLESQCLVSFGKYLARNGIIDIIPFSLDGIKKPKSVPLEWFSKNEIESILKNARKQDKKIFEVLAFTGMRISELMRLTWDDVDFSEGFINVVSTIADPTKSGMSRKIPMHFRVIKVLSEIENKEGFVFNAGKSKKYPLIDGPISGRKVLKRLRKICDILVIEGCLHSFRKFFCSYMANSGVPPTTLIKWSGHKDLKVLMDHYYKLSDDDSLEIMNKFTPHYSQNKKAEYLRGQVEDSFEDSPCILKIEAS